jgi:hypothetical protein
VGKEQDSGTTSPMLGSRQKAVERKKEFMPHASYLILHTLHFRIARGFRTAFQ